jgi:hypothetical protein
MFIYLRGGYVMYCYSGFVIVMLLAFFLVCWFLCFLLPVAILIVSCSGSVRRGGVGCVCC